MNGDRHSTQNAGDRLEGLPQLRSVRHVDADVLGSGSRRRQVAQELTDLRRDRSSAGEDDALGLFGGESARDQSTDLTGAAGDEDDVMAGDARALLDLGRRDGGRPAAAPIEADSRRPIRAQRLGNGPRGRRKAGLRIDVEYPNGASVALAGQRPNVPEQARLRAVAVPVVVRTSPSRPPSVVTTAMRAGRRAAVNGGAGRRGRPGGHRWRCPSPRSAESHRCRSHPRPAPRAGLQ